MLKTEKIIFKVQGIFLKKTFSPMVHAIPYLTAK